MWFKTEKHLKQTRRHKVRKVILFEKKNISTLVHRKVQKEVGYQKDKITGTPIEDSRRAFVDLQGKGDKSEIKSPSNDKNEWGGDLICKVGLAFEDLGRVDAWREK